MPDMSVGPTGGPPKSTKRDGTTLTHSSPPAIQADKAARRQLRRSASFDRRERMMGTKNHHSANSLHQKEAKQSRRKSAGGGSEVVDSSRHIYNKKNFNFEHQMDSLLENVSFDFNCTDAMLIVRSPSVRPRHAGELSPSRGDRLRHSGHLSHPISSDEESGSLHSPSGSSHSAIGFDIHDSDFQGDVYTAGKQRKSKGSRGPSREKESKERGSDEQSEELFEAGGEQGTTRETESRGLLFNFRDLSQATSIGVVPGLAFRSAALTRAEVHPEDVHRALVFLRKGLNIKTIIDLRAKDEKAGDKLDWIVEKVALLKSN